MIDPIITNPKQDNDLQLARTASIPANEKYHAKEWNAIIDKINEIINDLSLGQITDSVTKTTASNIVRLVEGALIETNLTIRDLPEATTEQKMILLNSLGEAALADVSDYIKKLESSDPQGQYVLLADGTRIDPQLLIEEKEIIAYDSSNPRPAVGESDKLYIDTDTNDAYLWNETTQEYVGIGVIDLSNYYNQQQVDALLNGKLNIGEGGELKKIGNGYGLQHQIDNPDNYGTLGENAVSFTFSNSIGNFGASGESSHAEGYRTRASGLRAHAEGGQTIASGANSHAEGVVTIASGSASHAEGNSTTASGNASHSEGENTVASGRVSHAEGFQTTAGSYAENARGTFNEIITPINATAFDSNDVVESVGVGTSNSNRKNALTRWKNGAFKWLLQPLTNITNAVIGFHAADEDGRLNYHDGTEWKKYALEGEGGGGYIEIKDQFNDSFGEVDLDLITEEGTYVLKEMRDEDLNNLPYYSGDGPVNVQIDVFVTEYYTMQRAIYYTATDDIPILAYRVKYGSDPYQNWSHSYKEDYNGVAYTITSNIATSYNIAVINTTQHYNLTMTADTDLDFIGMIEANQTKVITITLSGDFAFTFPSWLKPLETNDDYDTIGGSLAAEIVINIKNGGATPQGYYSLQMVDYAL